MTIHQTKDGDKLTLALEGRLDTTTAPQLEAAAELDDVKELIVDLEKLEYISSAGLRVLLAMQKRMNKQGKMTVCHVNAIVREVFDITGFSDVLQLTDTL